MNEAVTRNFKATALDNETLRRQAPSIFAAEPMAGVSGKYTFVPTSQVVGELRAHQWLPVVAQEQRVRTEARRGFQRHLLRFRRAEQMETLDEWNVELVLVNSHDAGCAYQLHAGLYRRICANGLVTSNGTFQALRFRHSGLWSREIVEASVRLLEFVPRLAALVQQFQARELEGAEAEALAEAALRLRYPNAEEAPVAPRTLLRARRVEDQGPSLWLALNRLAENLCRGGLSDHRRDRHGHLRSVRPLRGIDSQMRLHKGLWGLAERRLAEPEPVPDEALALAD
jgi:hypothetical protein